MSTNQQARKTILIVEDDESISEVMSITIANETVHVPIVVSSGAAALQAIQLHNPSLIFLDYLIADMTGIELYDQLSAQGMLQNLTAVLVSAGNHDREVEQRGLQILEKPFDLDDFINIIENICSSASYSR